MNNDTTKTYFCETFRNSVGGGDNSGFTLGTPNEMSEPLKLSWLSDASYAKPKEASQENLEEATRGQPCEAIGGHAGEVCIARLEKGKKERLEEASQVKPTMRGQRRTEKASLRQPAKRWQMMSTNRGQKSPAKRGQKRLANRSQQCEAKRS